MNKNIYFKIMPKGYGKTSKEVKDYIDYLQKENERLKVRNEMLELINFCLIRKEYNNERK